jgi:hypothetical protein
MPLLRPAIEDKQKFQEHYVRAQVARIKLVVICSYVCYYGLVHFPHPTQNISSSIHHIKSFDTCMEH